MQNVVNYLKKIATIIILLILIVLSFFLLKPILLSIIFGFILAFIFTPVYNLIVKLTKNPSLSSSLVCIILISLVVLPLWFLTPIVIDQSIKIYAASQQIDFVEPLKIIFPSLFASDTFSAEVGSVIRSFVTKTTNSLMNTISQLILNFPKIFLQLAVVFFTLFFTLRDKELFVNYIKSLSPFPKDIEKKLFDSSREITSSVLYGQVVVGILQGIIAGIGFFVFKVPNALILTLLAIVSGIFPIVGTAIVWAPVTVYLFIAGNPSSALGILLFGTFSSTIDNFLRPIIVSRRTKMPTSLIIMGMIGGGFLFGMIGFILGPLILAYLITILEIYRTKESPKIFTSSNK